MSDQTVNPPPGFVPIDQFEALQAQLLQLRQLVNQLEQRHRSPSLPPSRPHTPPPPPPPPPPPAHHDDVDLPTIKVAKPDPFDGNSKKVLDFIHQCNLYLSSQPDNLPERRKVLFALSYMSSGAALSWGERRLRDLVAANFQGVTWATFEAELRSTFGDIDRSTIAKTELEKIKQGSLTADAYNVDFNKWRFDTGYNDDALITFYKKGLNVPLLKDVYKIRPLPTTIDAWMTSASVCDRQFREMQAFHHSVTTTSSSSTRKGQKQSSTSSSSFKPSISSSSSSKPASSSRTTNAITTSSAPLPIKNEAVDPVIAAKRKENGECVLCGSSDHWARACPKNKRNTSSNRGRGRGGSSQSSSSRHIRAVEKDSEIKDISILEKHGLHELSKSELKAISMQLMHDVG
jgi:hypothetical protein